MLIVACQKKENSEQKNINSVEQSFIELQSNINSYNEQFYKIHDIDISANMEKFNMSKAWSWSRFWAVVKADFIGAAIGAIAYLSDPLSGTVCTIVLAVTTSIEAGRTFGKAPDNTSEDIIFPSDNKVFGTDVGYYHNIIVKNMFIKYSDLQTVSSTELLNRVIKEAHLLGLNITAASRNTASLLNYSRKSLSIVEQSSSNKEIADELTAIYPNKKQEFDILRNYLFAVEPIQDNNGLVSTYATGSISIVEQSSIPDESKQNIISALATSANSANLWSE
jgi:hypothetical protein